VTYALCNDRRTLLWFANQRAVEYHPTLALAGHMDHPTYLILDIDPPEGGPFGVAVRAALLVREALAGAGLAGAVKTSGAKGVHVFVPVAHRVTSEEVAAATSAQPWFQLYVMRDRAYAESLMARAQAVEAPVLILTIDLAVVGARHRDTRNAAVGRVPAWGKLRRGLDLLGHPRWIRDVGLGGKPLTFGNLEQAVPGASTPAAFRGWVDAQFDPSVTWEDIAWVRRNWSGRLVVKGILDPEDARRAVDAGVDGLIVSNHGGRQLDSVPSSARALPAVVDAVGQQVEVLVDGGVRTGLDVVKLMAMGARAVLIGRAWAWAVAAGGERGVRHVLKIMKSDIDVALGLTGHTSVGDLDRSALVTEP